MVSIITFWQTCHVRNGSQPQIELSLLAGSLFFSSSHITSRYYSKTTRLNAEFGHDGDQKG